MHTHTRTHAHTCFFFGKALGMYKARPRVPHVSTWSILQERSPTYENPRFLSNHFLYFRICTPYNTLGSAGNESTVLFAFLILGVFVICNLYSTLGPAGRGSMVVFAILMFGIFVNCIPYSSLGPAGSGSKVQFIVSLYFQKIFNDFLKDPFGHTWVIAQQQRCCYAKAMRKSQASNQRKTGRNMFDIWANRTEMCSICRTSSL